MKRRFLWTLLMICMLVGLLATTAFAAETVDETNGYQMSLDYNPEQCTVTVSDRENDKTQVVSGDYLLQNSWGEACAEVIVNVKDGYRIKSVIFTQGSKTKDLTEDFIMGVYGWKPMLYASSDFYLSVETEAVPSDIPTVTDVQIYFDEYRSELIKPGRNFTVTEDSSTYVYVKCTFSDGEEHPEYAARGYLEYSIDGVNWETSEFGGFYNYFPVDEVQYAIKYAHSSTAYTNYDFRIRIEPDDKHCTGGTVYSEVYHVNGGVDGDAGGYTLAAPTDLTWHKFYQSRKDSASVDYNGIISWVVCDPEYDQYLEFKVYKNVKE